MTALITGASSGIGLALARRFARDGHRLLLTARDSTRLERAAEEARRAGALSVETIVADLAEPDGVERLLGQVRAPVDVLVNNAGAGVGGAWLTGSAESDAAQLAVNVLAPTRLARALVPPMAARGRGWMLNVASTAGFQPGPWFAVYYATKAYLLAFSEALGEELRQSHVLVCTLCPGPTATEFTHRAGLRTSALATSRLVPGVEAVAEAGYRGMWRGTPVVIPGLLNRLQAGLVRLAPRGVVRRAVGTRNRGRASAAPPERPGPPVHSSSTG